MGVGGKGGAALEEDTVGGGLDVLSTEDGEVDHVGDLGEEAIAFVLGGLIEVDQEVMGVVELFTNFLVGLSADTGDGEAGVSGGAQHEESEDRK